MASDVLGDAVHVCASQLEELLSRSEAGFSVEADEILPILEELSKLPMTLQVLKETRIGLAVNHKSLRKHGAETVRTKSAKLVGCWKKLAKEQRHDALPVTDSKAKVDIKCGASSASSATYSAAEYFLYMKRSAESAPVEAKAPKIASDSDAGLRDVPLAKLIGAATPRVKLADDSDDDLRARRQALHSADFKKREAALLKEVLHYLRSHGRKASMAELNAEVQRIFGSTSRLCSHAGQTSWKMPRPGAGDAPMVGLSFVQRNRRNLRLQQRRVQKCIGPRRTIWKPAGYDVVLVGAHAATSGGGKLVRKTSAKKQGKPREAAFGRNVLA